MDDPEKFPFNKLNVEDAPADSGVYALYEGRETIYAGKADADGVTIRSCLQSHLRGDKGECTKAANSFSYEVVRDDIEARLKEMLDHFAMFHRGRQPRCN